MNSVNLIGRITAVPEVRYTPTGTAVANTSLAVDDGYGEKKTTLFLGVTFWGKSAEAAGKYLVKGQRIGVKGRLSQEEYTPKGGDKPIRKTHVTVEDFYFLDKPAGADGGERRDTGESQQQEPRREQQKQRQSTPPPAGDHDEEDDIPF